MRLPCTRATSVSARDLEALGSPCVPQAEFECPQVRNPRWFPTGAFFTVTGSVGFRRGTPSLVCRRRRRRPARGRPAADRCLPHKWRAAAL